ncbi:MAG: amidohydrolase family protein [Bacteroidetes bacterium]|nr:amidohydrolase family protein [Bacteroidota bacterium]MBL6962521.1 amidohydrolase family protein [Bacteroidota bacterium]
MVKKINAHGHLLPNPEQIPKFMKERKIFWVDDDRSFMRQGDWARPISHPSFFLEEKLQWMEKNKIEHEVVLTLSQLYCNGYDEKTAMDAIRFQNDFNAQLQADHPQKFTSGFVVQAAYMDSALKEIERCVKDMKMHLLCLPSHFLDQNKEWCSIADERLDPLFKLADTYKLAIEIHPYDGSKMIGLEDRLWRYNLVWMCAQTADTYHMYTSLAFPDKYPRIRTCFAHGNQFGQMNVGRRLQGFKGRPDLFEGAVSPDTYIGHPKIYFDSLLHDQLSFEMLIRRQGVSQIVAGLDDPYPLGEMETVEGCYPGILLDEALKSGLVKQNEYDAIWNKNPLKWLTENS